MVQWRLIPFIETSGAIQMAIDEWLLEQHRMGNMPPVLRFYTWSPIAISLGYHQHRYPDAWHSLAWQGQGVDIVRRPSGGRAVLHQGDLTYAVILSTDTLNTQAKAVQDDPSSTPRSIKRSEIYRRLCQFLIEGFRRLDVTLDYGTAGRGYIHNPNCFGTATTADLVLSDGTKLIGSAQLRRGTAILQHGSIRIEPSPELFYRIFGQDAVLPNLNRWFETSQLSPDSTYDTILNTMMNSLIASACECFGMEYTIQPLSPHEWNSVLAQSHKWHKPQQGK